MSETKETKKRIFWTFEEKNLVAEATAKLVAQRPDLSLLDCTRIAQKELPPLRHKPLKHLWGLDWLKPLVDKRVAEIRASQVDDTPASVEDANSGEFDTVDEDELEPCPEETNLFTATVEDIVYELGKRIAASVKPEIMKMVEDAINQQIADIHFTLPPQELCTHLEITKKKPDVRKPTVLIAGLLPSQKTTILTNWADKLSLRFWHTGSAIPVLRDMARNVDVIFVMTDKVSHKVSQSLTSVKRKDADYIRQPGSVTALEKSLNRLFTRVEASTS